MKWISIKDKLPEHHQTVLAYTKKGQCVTIFLDSVEMNKRFKKDGYGNKCINVIEDPYSFSSQENKGNILNGVTHWMPLPTHPEEYNI